MRLLLQNINNKRKQSYTYNNCVSAIVSLLSNALFFLYMLTHFVVDYSNMYVLFPNKLERFVAGSSVVTSLFIVAVPYCLLLELSVPKTLR